MLRVWQRIPHNCHYQAGSCSNPHTCFCHQDSSHVEGWNEKLASGESPTHSRAGTAYVCLVPCVFQLYILLSVEALLHTNPPGCVT